MRTFTHCRPRIAAITFVFAAALAGSLLVAAPAHAVISTEQVGAFTYNYDAAAPSAGATVTAFDETLSPSAVVIPNSVTLGGTSYVVTAIGDTAAFCNKHAEVTSVDLPDSLVKIGNSAFCNDDLSSLVIPSTVTSIGLNAFYGNDLVNVTIPANVTDIEYGAFNNNSGLTNVTLLGPAPTVVDADTAGESFDTTNSALRVRYPFAFGPPLAGGYTTPLWHGYDTLPSDISATLKGITYVANVSDVAAGAKVVDYSASTGSVVAIPATVTFGNKTFNVTSIGTGAFQFKSLTKITIPHTVKTIGPQGFSGNNLGAVVIPNSVTSIGEDAFYSSGLTSVTISNAITAIPTNAFGVNPLAKVTIPAGVTTIGDFAFYADPLTEVTIPAAVTTIGASAFGVNEALTSVTLKGDPPTVTPAGLNQSFNTSNAGFAVLYPAGKTAAYAPSPWNGYAAKPYVGGLAPTITGTAREKSTLTAGAGPVDSVAAIAYQWKADGKNISGATGPTLKLTKAQAGRRITVRVTATFPGAATVVKISPRTRIVGSSYKRIVLSKTSVKKGHSFVVVATGFKPRQTVRIRLNNVTRWSGRADAYGVINRSVTFKSDTRAGRRSVKVQYRSGRTYKTGIGTSIRYYK